MNEPFDPFKAWHDQRVGARRSLDSYEAQLARLAWEAGRSYERELTRAEQNDVFDDSTGEDEVDEAIDWLEHADLYGISVVGPSHEKLLQVLKDLVLWLVREAKG